jgi:hypothetical protein
MKKDSGLHIRVLTFFLQERSLRFRPDCRNWAIRFSISMRSSTAPTIASSAEVPE